MELNPLINVIQANAFRRIRSKGIHIQRLAQTFIHLGKYRVRDSFAVVADTDNQPLLCLISIDFHNSDDKQLCEKFFMETQDIDKRLVKNGVFNMYFSTLIDEDMTTILVNEEVYDVKQKRLILKEMFPHTFTP